MQWKYFSWGDMRSPYISRTHSAFIVASSSTRTQYTLWFTIIRHLYFRVLLVLVRKWDSIGWRKRDNERERESEGWLIYHRNHAGLMQHLQFPGGWPRARPWASPSCCGDLTCSFPTPPPPLCSDAICSRSPPFAPLQSSFSSLAKIQSIIALKVV